MNFGAFHSPLLPALSSILLLWFVAAYQISAVEVDIPRKSPPAGIKHIITYTHTDSHGKIKRSAIRYDKYGNKTEKKVYKEGGELQWVVAYTYDATDHYRLLEKTAYEPEGEQVWRTEYSYDESGRISRVVNHDRFDKTNYTKVYEYEENKIETLMYGPDGSVRWRKSEFKNENNKISRIYYYYPDGSRIKGIIREYNSMGKVSEETHIDEIGAVFRRFVTEYDELGRVTGRRVYDHKGEIHRRMWVEYLDNGHIRRVRHIIPPENREEEYVYAYTTDKRGGWIRREETVRIHTPQKDEGIVQHIVESRDIEYFSYQTGEE